MNALRHRIGIVTAALVLLAGCRGLNSENYFPAAPGSTWSYTGTLKKATDDAKTPDETLFQKTEIASAAGQEKATVVFHSDAKTGQGVETQEDSTWIVTGESATWVSFGGGGKCVIEPPLPVLHFPVLRGQWEWKGRFPLPDGKTVPASATIRTAGRDKLTTPAGIITTYSVEVLLLAEVEGQATEFPLTFWFGPNVGLVQTQQTLPAPKAERFTRTYTLAAYHLR